MVMVTLELQLVTHLLILEIIVRYINVGIVTRRENFMKKLLMILSMMVLLTNCTKSLEFDGFDPSTTVLRWVITGDKK